MKNFNMKCIKNVYVKFLQQKFNRYGNYYKKSLSSKNKSKEKKEEHLS